MIRNHRPDARAITLTALVHGALLALLLLAQAPPLPVAPDRMLSVFDVAPPPPPPPPIIEVPPPPPARPSVRPPGGSPPPSAAPPETVDLTPLPLADPPPLTAPITSPFADAIGIGLQPGAGNAQGRRRGTGTGSGDGSGDGGVRYLRAEWIRKPTIADMSPYWPRRARLNRLSGRVDLACIVPKPGRPKRCWVIAESDRKIGFGRAAVAMSHLFRLRPVRRNGEPVDVPVIVPVSYQYGEVTPPQAP